MRSALKENPFWKKYKPSKATKIWYKEKYGLKAKEIYLPTEKYYNLIKRLFGVSDKL